MVKLKSLVKKKKRSVLNKIINFFTYSSYNAYLVGGIIRDTILKSSTKDIDIAIEGNAIKAGYALNRILEGKLETHKNFGTISIFKDNMRIDLATTRKEIYRHPGALPIVSKSNIYEDLRRRDFTINAIALSISKNNYGEIFDPFDGTGDIKRKLIRVLYEKSFIDDPTRIFRALRYKSRLNFKLEVLTEKLLSDAILKSMIEKISKQRIMNELKLIFTEKTYQKILKDLKKYKIFMFSKKKLKNITAVGDLKYYYFLNLIGAESFPLSNQEKKIINDLKKLAALRKLIKRTTTNSSLYYTLNGFDEKVIKVISKLYPDLKYAIQRYQSLKKTKPLINGKDLKKLRIKTGPAFKEILTKIYKLQLDRKIRNKKTAIAFLKNG